MNSWFQKASSCFIPRNDLNWDEKSGISDIRSFVVEYYMNSWFQAESSCFTPRNNLQFLKELRECEGINYEISKCAVNNLIGYF